MPGFLLLTVKISEVVLPSGTVAAANAFLTTPGPTTSPSQALVPPGPLWSEVMGPLVFLNRSGLSAFTSTEITQLACAANAPPEKAMAVETGTAVTLPPQVLLTLVGPATAKPGGNVS